MHPNEHLIHNFYTAFQDRDHQFMQASYADDASFNDPVFRTLDAVQVRSMWEMFCKRSKDLTIEFSDVKATADRGTATWEAMYTFTPTGKPVINKIRAEFTFREGKIINHVDTFSFYNWARQALGWKGLLLGWAPVVQRKVRQMACNSLDRFMSLGV